MIIRSIAVSAMGALALSACQRPAEAPAPAAPTTEVAQVAYACDSGQSVTAEYPDASTARVIYKDKTHTLRLMPSASGARYVGTEYEWWTATRDGQEEGRLNRIPANAEETPAQVERCARPAPAVTTPAPAPAPVTAGVEGLAASPPCISRGLRLTDEGGDAGMGNRVMVLGVVNTSARTCSLAGYPAVAVLDRQGRVLTAIRSEQSPGNYFRNAERPRPVEVAAGAKAYFDIAWNVVPHEDQGETACPTVTRLQVTAPGDTGAMALERELTPCGGRVRVSPFRPTDLDAAPTR